VTFTPDAALRVTKVRRSGFDAQGLPVGLDVATYTYEAHLDDIKYLKDGKNVTTAYTHDDFGRLELLQATSLKAAEFAYGYDARGNVLKRVAGQVTVTYTYDGLDRLSTVLATNAVDGTSVAYTYRYDEPGGEGFLTSVVEPDRTIRFGHDASGRLVRESLEENGVPAPLVTQYGYDSDGDLTALAYPSGLQLTYVRDAATKRVVRAVNGATGIVYADLVRTLPGGPVTSLRFGNGLALAQSFNRRYESVSVASGPVELGYATNAAGDVTTISDRSETLSGCRRDAVRHFGYDFLDRLGSSQGLLAYGYDATGNRASEEVEGVAASFAYYNGNFSDRITTKRVTSGGTAVNALAFGYDFQGNVTAIGSYDAAGARVVKAVCLRHDALGRLTVAGAANPAYVTPDAYACTTDAPYLASVSARFRYDSRNRRVARQDAATGRWTYFVSDAAGNLLAELALEGGAWRAVREYVWLEGRPLAQVEHPTAETSFTYYLHADAIGLPRAMTNGTGQLVWNALHRPYGDIEERTATDPLSGRTVVTNLRLPGQYDERLLSSVGLQGPYYNWNRWYLPSVGRYLELDPIALAGGSNEGFGPEWHNYGNGNPLRNIDPWGLEPAPRPQPDPGSADPGILVILYCLLDRNHCGLAPQPPPTWQDPPGYHPPQPQPDPNDCSPKKDKGCSCRCVAGGIGPATPGHADSPSDCAAMCAAIKRKSPEYSSIFKWECGKASGGIQ
jgi:RHS repeat-associated protein